MLGKMAAPPGRVCLLSSILPSCAKRLAPTPTAVPERASGRMSGRMHSAPSLMRAAAAASPTAIKVWAEMRAPPDVIS